MKKQEINGKSFEEIFNEAHAAGMAAVEKLNVVPMVVAQHENQMNDNSPIVKSWFVADGVCGFAWVNIKPGNSPFAKYLKTVEVPGILAQGHKDDYYGGVTMWVGGFNQSMQKKEAYGGGFAGILQQYGIKAYMSSRMD